jgi:hypothetical protein
MEYPTAEKETRVDPSLPEFIEMLREILVTY